MVPSLRVEPQWSLWRRLMLIKGWKGGKRGRKGFGKVESPYEFQYELIKKGGKGTFIGLIH
jgi:hypothetical protein